MTTPFARRTAISTLVARACCVGALMPLVFHAQGAAAQAIAQVERPIAFDGGGRAMVLTPTVASRWKLAAPEWPLGTDWSEARLFSTESGDAVLVVQRIDGTVARYALTSDALIGLRRMVDAAIAVQGTVRDGAGVSTAQLSEPASNAFVRNQTTLGLIAYGPATAAILSDNGAAAGGGYLFAAGASFFLAANMVRNRSVSRAQTILAFHGGTRGSIFGASVAAIADVTGGPGYGIPILVGGIGGTVAGFQGAKGLSDGEAASSGFAADIGALTALGVAGALDAYADDRTSRSGNRLQTKGRVALGAGIGAAAIGYLVGPRYARRSAYNVTAGDIDVAFTSAALGALAAQAAVSDGSRSTTRYAASTVGMLTGALLADRTKVRHADRSPGDGTQIQIGAIAGMLMGAGIALATETESHGTIALLSGGGLFGLLVADGMVRPAADAGAKRGVLRSSGLTREAGSPRVSLSLVPAAVAMALHLRGGRDERAVLGSRLAPTRVAHAPMGRVTF